MFELKLTDKGEGVKDCPKHGSHTLAGNERQKLHSYRLNQWQLRLDEFADSSTIKSVRGEIGVLRILMEQILESCPDQNALILHAPRIADLASRLESLIVTCNKIEERTGIILDQDRAVKFATLVTTVIQKYITDPTQLASLSNDIMEALVSATN